MAQRDPARRQRAPFVAVVAAAALAGCMVGPDYRRPDVEVPAAYRIAPQDAAAADAAWWEAFGDPVLSDLVRAALAANQDVRLAAARVDQFLGALNSTRAELYPQVGAAFDASRARVSREQGTSTLPAQVDPTFSYYQPALQASWEIDLWGRIRRSTEAARADVLGAESARRGVVLSLVAQVANGYIQLRDLDRQLEIAQDTVRTRADSLRVFELRFKGGVVSQLELAQSQSEYETAAATVPTLQQQIVATENALALLLGRNPGPIPRGRAVGALAAPPIPAGLPSELLQRRPDIQQAEQQLVAANARIGAARALYYPAISLTGAYGSASTDLSRLFTGPTATWALAAGVTAPIFNAGAIAGQVAQAEALQQQALAGYVKAVQSAFGDVDTALSATTKARESVAAYGRTVESLSTYARLARLRYDNGYTSYLEVTDAETRLFNAQLSYTQAQQQALAAVVGVYAALGGGWIDVADRSTSSGIANTAPVTERADRLPLF